MAQDIQTQLNEAIAAARRGDRTTAQRLLQAVVRQDSENELAWMWLASTSTTAADKRRYLQRVLSINPNNQTAQAALQQLGGTPSIPQSSTAASDGSPPPWRNLITIAIVLAGVITVLLIGVVIVNGVREALQIQPDANAVVVFETQLAESQTPATEPPTALPTVTFTPASVIVSPNAATLPPTFTPTALPTATETPIPSETPLPLSNYRVLFTSLGQADPFASLYQISGDGAGEAALDVFAREAVYSPDGSLIAFLAPPVVPTSEDDPGTQDISETVEIHIVPADDLQDITQLTDFGTDDLTGIGWSPDSREIVYVRDGINLEGIEVSNPDNVMPYLVGEETGIKTDVIWSLDGARILFASDGGVAGGPLEIYALDIENDAIEQLTDDVGSSFSPVFSPDGTQIAFISDRNGDGDVFVMEADGSAARLLTQDDAEAEDRTPAWSPDGNWIAFSSTRGENDTFQIFMIDPQTTNVVQVTNNSRNNRSPSFRPR